MIKLSFLLLPYNLLERNSVKTQLGVDPLVLSLALSYTPCLHAFLLFAPLASSPEEADTPPICHGASLVGHSRDASSSLGLT